MATQKDIQDLKKLAEWLDSKYRLPGGFRIGWDGILGFIPGVGDFVTSLVSLYIMARAAAIGVSPAVIIRMGLNVLLDNLFDLVPFLGNFFDIFWKANTKNMALVDRYVSDPRHTTRSSKIAVFLTLLVVAAVLVASAALIIWVVAALWNYLVQMNQDAMI
ncbi:MAG: DUF4112 domain-containing protein [Bdellovibrionaceae bacterium]|nr:DUF4112 domain-containing protein [Pseudobdellovibrionaceae bacterium]